MTDLDPARVLPAWLVEHARSWAGRPDARPVEPRRAATVLLLRDTPGGPEVYLIRRAATMAFASGMYAFPGGSVDPRDADHAVGWAGPDPRWWAGRLGVDEPTARAVVCAAVRETFEECGVLLAGPDPATVVGDVSGDEWEAARRALVSRDLGFAEFLSERRLVLRADLLGPWARWITPEFEPRRYDTYFFVAALPAAQRTRWVAGEADLVAWVRPVDAVTGHGTGDFAMLPPTVETLRQLVPHGDVAASLAASAGRDAAVPVMPRAVLDGDGARMVLPGEPGY